MKLVHTVRITLQHRSFKNYLEVDVRGNIKGFSVLEDAVMVIRENMVNNHCQIKFTEDDDCQEWFSMVLHDGDDT